MTCIGYSNQMHTNTDGNLQSVSEFANNKLSSIIYYEWRAHAADSDFLFLIHFQNFTLNNSQQCHKYALYQKKNGLSFVKCSRTIISPKQSVIKYIFF